MYTIGSKTPYTKYYTVHYGFIGSVWEHEQMAAYAISEEQAKDKVLDEIAKAYGSAILKDVIIKKVVRH